MSADESEQSEARYTSAFLGSGQAAGPVERSMRVRPAKDSSSAAWAKEALDPYTWSEEGLRVRSLVPEGFEAYARLFYEPWYLGPEAEARVQEIGELTDQMMDLDEKTHMPRHWPPKDPRFFELLKEREELIAREPTLKTWREIAESNGKVAHPNMEWHQIATKRVDDEELVFYGPELGSEELRLVVETLRPYTGHEELCTFLVWEGYGFAELQESKAPRIELGHEHLIFEGPLDSALQFTWDGSWEQPPNMWWPKSRAWCVASEIDMDTGVIGGSRELIDAFLEHPKLECLPVNADDPIHAQSDFINGGDKSERWRS